MFYRNAEKKLAREQRKLSRCEKGSRNYHKQKKKVALYHGKIKNQSKDFQRRLSHSLAEDYYAVCVEDLNLKGIAGGLHFGKGIQDNGYGQFLSMPVSYTQLRRPLADIRWAPCPMMMICSSPSDVATVTGFSRPILWTVFSMY